MFPSVKTGQSGCLNFLFDGFTTWLEFKLVQLISVALEHSVLRVQEIYALENAVFLHSSLWVVQAINFRNMEC